MFLNQVETYSGLAYDLDSPKASQLNVHDISHSLSNQCRFGGHSLRFYSMAEHCWHVARMLEGFSLEIQLGGLFYAASSAYAPMPVGKLADTGYYSAIKGAAEAVIAKRFNIEYPFHPAVVHADNVMLSTEAWHLLANQGKDWTWPTKRPIVSKEYRPVCMDPETAAANFIDKYHEIRSAMHAMKIASGRIDNERTDGTIGGTSPR